MSTLNLLGTQKNGIPAFRLRRRQPMWYQMVHPIHTAQSHMSHPIREPEPCLKRRMCKVNRQVTKLRRVRMLQQLM